MFYCSLEVVCWSGLLMMYIIVVYSWYVVLCLIVILLLLYMILRFVYVVIFLWLYVVRSSLPPLDCSFPDFVGIEVSGVEDWIVASPLPLSQYACIIAVSLPLVVVVRGCRGQDPLLSVLSNPLLLHPSMPDSGGKVSGSWDCWNTALYSPQLCSPLVAVLLVDCTCYRISHLSPVTSV